MQHQTRASVAASVDVFCGMQKSLACVVLSAYDFLAKHLSHFVSHLVRCCFPLLIVCLRFNAFVVHYGKQLCNPKYCGFPPGTLLKLLNARTCFVLSSPVIQYVAGSDFVSTCLCLSTWPCRFELAYEQTSASAQRKGLDGHVYKKFEAKHHGHIRELLEKTAKSSCNSWLHKMDFPLADAWATTFAILHHLCVASRQAVLTDQQCITVSQASKTLLLMTLMY